MKTAEEFARSFTTGKSVETPTEYITEMLKEFTKLHVQAALESASEKADGEFETLGGKRYSNIKIYKESILNAYSLDNIK